MPTLVEIVATHWPDYRYPTGLAAHELRERPDLERWARVLDTYRYRDPEARNPKWTAVRDLYDAMGAAGRRGVRKNDGADDVRIVLGCSVKVAASQGGTVAWAAELLAADDCNETTPTDLRNWHDASDLYDRLRAHYGVGAILMQPERLGWRYLAGALAKLCDCWTLLSNLRTLNRMPLMSWRERSLTAIDNAIAAYEPDANPTPF